MSKLYDLCKKLNLKPKHVVEVGVWLPQDSQCLAFCVDIDCHVDLFEPLSEAICRITQHLKSNSTLFKFGIYDYDGEATLMIPDGSSACASASAYIDGINSPSLVNDKQKHFRKETIQVRKFGQFDNGTIDVISLDCEGCEWFTLKNMISRPEIISVEMGDPCRDYNNPFTKDIENWLNFHGYVQIAQDKADKIYRMVH